MERKKSIDSEVYTYCSIEDALSECHRITNKETGVSIKADGELKLSYTRMRKRFDFFNNNGRDFYDSIETLWKSCTSSKSTFEDRLKKLKQVGLVTSVGKKGSVQKHTVAAMNPDDFLLERNDPILGWVNCLEYPVFGSTRQQEPPKVEDQETAAFTETNPALPSSDDIHTPADPGSDDSQCEQQREPPPDDYCADDWLADFQSEPDERSDDEKLESIYEEYKLYCDLEGIDYKAYQESFIQFMDKTMIDSRFEEFKKLGQYLFNKDWEEESEQIFDDLEIPF